MKKIVFVLVLQLFAFAIHAQESNKTIVGILPIGYANSEYSSQAIQLNDIVTQLFSKNRHLQILDRGKVNQIFKELHLQQDYIFTDGITVKQNKAYGAQVLVAGNLSRVDTERVKTGGILNRKLGGDNAPSSYISKISFSLQAFDVTTGKIRDAETFDISSADASSMNVGLLQTSGDPYKNAVYTNKNIIIKKVQEWINKLYPPVIKIAQVDKRDKNNNPKLILIISDDPLNVKKGDMIGVNEITEIEFEGRNRIRSNEIALLKVVELQGDFVQCEVKKGEDVIEDKWKNSKITLQIKDKKSFFDKF